jgi:hypothetical protein
MHGCIPSHVVPKEQLLLLLAGVPVDKDTVEAKQLHVQDVPMPYSHTAVKPGAIRGVAGLKVACGTVAHIHKTQHGQSMCCAAC